MYMDDDRKLTEALLDVVAALKAWQHGLVPPDNVAALRSVHARVQAGQPHL